MHYSKDKFIFHFKNTLKGLKEIHILDIKNKKFGTQYDSAYEIARHLEIKKPKNEIFMNNSSFKDCFYNVNLVLKNEFKGNVNNFVTWWENNKTEFITWNQEIERNFIELYKSKIKFLPRDRRYETYEEWLKNSYPVLDKTNDNKMFRTLRTIFIINDLISENKSTEELWTYDEKWYCDWYLKDLNNERYNQEEIHKAKQLLEYIEKTPKHDPNPNLLEIEKLINQQSNLYIANEDNCLLIEAIKKYSPKLLELLLIKGVDPNNIWDRDESATSNKNSALDDFVNFMIEEEDDCNNTKSENLASNNINDNLQKMLQILIDWGANLDAENEENITPMSLLYGNSFTYLDPEYKIFKTALMANLELIKKLNLIKLVESNKLADLSLEDLNAGNSEKSYCEALLKSIIKDCDEKLKSVHDEDYYDWEKHFANIICVVIDVINQNNLDIKITDCVDYHKLSLKSPNLKKQINSYLEKKLSSQESDLVEESLNIVDIDNGDSQEWLTDISESNLNYSQCYN